MLKEYLKYTLMLGSLCCILLYAMTLNNSLCLFSLLSLGVYMSYSSLLYISSCQPEEVLTRARLVVVMSAFSLIYMFLFIWMSFHFDGDTFLFSKADAKVYESVTSKMVELGFVDSIEFIREQISDYADWGGPVIMTTFLRVINDKIFLNICNVLMGTLCGLMIFNMGMRIMSRKLSYISALSFSISSYSVFFYGSFLKETSFVLFVVLAMNSIYKFIVEKSYGSLLYAGIYCLVICFFRPAVTLMMITSFIIYYYIANKNNVTRFIMICIIMGSITYLASEVISMYNRHTVNGSISLLIETKESSALGRDTTYILNFIAAYLGPLPSLITKEPSLLPFYGPGLLFKVFMFLPFILGCIDTVKNKFEYMLPMILFIFLESTMAATVLKGFELRLTYLHIPFFFLVAFWAWENCTDKINVWIKKYGIQYLVGCVIMVLGWNLLRN